MLLIIVVQYKFILVVCADFHCVKVFVFHINVLQKELFQSITECNVLSATESLNTISDMVIVDESIQNHYFSALEYVIELGDSM